MRDGINRPISRWAKQISRVIGNYNLDADGRTWTTLVDNIGTIPQHDDVNCGPIACFHLFCFLNPLAAARFVSSPKYEVKLIRPFILAVLRSIIRYDSDHIFVNERHIKKMIPNEKKNPLNC